MNAVRDSVELREGLLDRKILHFSISVPEGREGRAWKISEQQIFFFPLQQ